MNTFSITTRKNIIASLIAPLAVIPASLVLTIYSLIANGSSLSKLTSETFFLIIIGLIYSYPLTILFGFTSVLILKRFKMYNLFNTLVIAVLVATIVCSFIVLTISVWLFASYYAVIVASIYWYVFNKVANKI